MRVLLLLLSSLAFIHVVQGRWPHNLLGEHDHRNLTCPARYNSSGGVFPLCMYPHGVNESTLPCNKTDGYQPPVFLCNSEWWQGYWARTTTLPPTTSPTTLLTTTAPTTHVETTAPTTTSPATATTPLTTTFPVTTAVSTVPPQTTSPVVTGHKSADVIEVGLEVQSTSVPTTSSPVKGPLELTASTTVKPDLKGDNHVFCILLLVLLLLLLLLFFILWLRQKRRRQRDYFSVMYRANPCGEENNIYEVI